MMKRRLLLPVAALALAAVVHVPATAAADQAADQARARELFKKGLAEYAKDHVKDAYALFRDAWALQKSFDIAGNLAAIEKQLGRPRDAAEHASYALANFPAGGSDNQRKALQDIVGEARSSCGAITIRVSVDKAAVTVDGKPVGESPLPYEVFAEPGSHTIVATAPGCDPAQDSVKTDKGSQHLITLTPRCGPKTTGGGGTGGAGGAGGGGTTVVPTGPRPIAVAGFITTGVGLGLGTAFAIMAKIKSSDADSQLQAIQSAAKGNSKPCAGATPSGPCNNLYDTLKSYDTFGNAAVWTFVAAGAVGAGTVIYTLVVPRSPAAPKAAAPQLIPLAGPGTGGLMLKGAF